MSSKKTEKLKVFVAMSGGVDSSVSAALLQRDGFDVVGVYMKQWSPKVLGSQCMWKEDRQDAMRVCAKLGIPFLTWDFSKEYEDQVGKYMIDSYRKGITPNPDVMCNKIIKFGLFFDKAMKEGADFIATGHYAINSATKFFEKSGPSLTGVPARFLKNSVASLLKAKDKNKDQTYFLYDIPQKVLAKTIFPLGNLTKPQVRELAKKFGLQNAQKKDSQGVCFVGPLNVKKFLQEYIAPQKGKIILYKSKKIIGSHDGVYYYTIGQRHGLDIKDGHGPYFVVAKNLNKNIIYVGSESDLYSEKCKVAKINWLAKPKKFPTKVSVQIRYRTKPAIAKIYSDNKIIFAKPVRAIAKGQSAVFYKGKNVLGGGVIC